MQGAAGRIDWCIIAEYYAFSIHVNQVDFLHKKFGLSAYSRGRLVAE